MPFALRISTDFERDPAALIHSRDLLHRILPGSFQNRKKGHKLFLCPSGLMLSQLKKSGESRETSLLRPRFPLQLFTCSTNLQRITLQFWIGDGHHLVLDSWGLYRDSVKIPRSTVICCPWGYVCDRSRFFLFFRNLFFLFSGQRAVFPLKPFQFFRSDKPLRHLSVCVYMINHTSQRIGCGRLVTVPH